MSAMKTLCVAIVLCTIVVIGCAPKEEAKPVGNDMDVLLDFMTGSFSSQEQSEADSAFFDIRLEMKQIWEDNTDGYWLYVEQAAASSLEKPYRQRVYHLTQIDDTTFSSAVWALEEPLRFAGAWKNVDLLANLTPDSLIERVGCAIILSKTAEGEYSGSTVGESCESSLRGATYATSSVVITADLLYSWDQGWDAEGNQVWGAEKGGYNFKRITHETEEAPAEQ